MNTSSNLLNMRFFNFFQSIYTNINMNPNEQEDRLNEYKTKALSFLQLSIGFYCELLSNLDDERLKLTDGDLESLFSGLIYLCLNGETDRTKYKGRNYYFKFNILLAIEGFGKYHMNKIYRFIWESFHSPQISEFGKKFLTSMPSTIKQNEIKGFGLKSFTFSSKLKLIYDYLVYEMFKIENNISAWLNFLEISVKFEPFDIYLYKCNQFLFNQLKSQTR